MIPSKFLCRSKHYLQLMRFHKPIGILLLWWPTAWALWLANNGAPPYHLVFLLFLGTVLMRAAGCVINDIADRSYDIHITRTKSRPLTSGKVSLVEAFILFIILSFFSFLILLKLPTLCFYYALAAIFVTILYPFCKRFINSPQMVLGIAFSMGIPMAFVASNQFDYSSMSLLFILNFLWIICYDTQYAMVDREEDLQIGINSTAILFGKYDRLIIGILQILFHSLWLLLFLKRGDISSKLIFSLCWGTASALLIYQQILMRQQERKKYFQAFNSNLWYGLLMWLPFISF